jgi:aminoglycoside phosphotransferase family enzyme/predicted kinase
MDDQHTVIEFLGASATHAGERVERIDTHSAIVFLAGARAWKLKRAVRYDYLDFSTPSRRQAMCEAEVRLNRRTAPALYHGVVAVTRERDGSLALGGAGTPIDWVVEMERFDQEALFDRLAEAGRLDLALMPPLAAGIARFHGAAEVRRDHGGKAGMTWVVEGNAADFARYGARLFDSADYARVTDDSYGELERHGALLDTRRETGFVRQCHGDLHLRNIVLLDGTPTLFDAVEFNDEIACIDVVYDLAFLLMDLWRRQLTRHANAIWNGYLDDTNDVDGVPLLPLFLSCRAAVRAKTSATAAGLQGDATRANELQQSAREYLAMAQGLLHPRRPCLVAVGGLSGSGKSTLAAGLAPAIGSVPGAIVLRSDVLRKQLCGVSPLQRLGPDGYTSEVTHRVYATLAARAGTILRAGHSVVVDAVHARPAEREAIERVATAAGVPFVGFWLDAPTAVMIERVESRAADPSDADEAVIRTQLAHDVGAIVWHRLVGSLPEEHLRQNAIAFLERRQDRNVMTPVARR